MDAADSWLSDLIERSIIHQIYSDTLSYIRIYFDLGINRQTYSLWWFETCWALTVTKSETASDCWGLWPGQRIIAKGSTAGSGFGGMGYAGCDDDDDDDDGWPSRQSCTDIPICFKTSLTGDSAGWSAAEIERDDERIWVTLLRCRSHVSETGQWDILGPVPRSQALGPIEKRSRCGRMR